MPQHDLLRLRAQPFDAVGDAQPLRLSPERRQLRAAADVGEAPGQRLRQGGQRIDEDIQSLLLDRPPDRQDRHGVRGIGTIASSTRGRGFGRAEAMEIEPMINERDAIRRRRVCLTCQFRFTTFERVQLRELVVIKRNGRRVPFDRDKLLRSLQIALRKRNIDPERLEQMVSKIVRDLESLGEGEISTDTIGETVMAHLRELDHVAYVRFASVYRNFREPKDFEDALAELASEEDGKAAPPQRK